MDVKFVVAEFAPVLGAVGFVSLGNLLMKVAINRHGPHRLWRRPIFILGFLLACVAQILGFYLFPQMPTAPLGVAALLVDYLISPCILGNGTSSDYLLGISGVIGGSLLLQFSPPNPLHCIDGVCDISSAPPLDNTAIVALAMVSVLAFGSLLWLMSYDHSRGPAVFAGAVIALGTALGEHFRPSLKLSAIGLAGIFYFAGIYALTESYARRRGVAAGRGFYLIWTGVQSALCGVVICRIHANGMAQSQVAGFFVGAAILLLTPFLCGSPVSHQKSYLAMRSEADSTSETESLNGGGSSHIPK